jgi:competence protein ComEC
MTFPIAIISLARAFTRRRTRAVGSGVMSRPRVTRDQGFAPFAWLFAFKAHAKNVIARTLGVPEPQASLLTGILLSDDSGIPKSVQDAFRTTGTSHIVAISGDNVTILVWPTSQRQ